MSSSNSSSNTAPVLRKEADQLLSSLTAPPAVMPQASLASNVRVADTFDAGTGREGDSADDSVHESCPSPSTPSFALCTDVSL